MAHSGHNVSVVGGGLATGRGETYQ